MITLYKEVQPADLFVVRLPYPFSDYDRQMLTLFYQPLIGAEAMSLFLTLWADAEQTENKELTHYYLMNSLNLPIGRIFEARISLEAIGLLRSWKKEEDNNRKFTYELIGPLDARSFFNDALLSVFLFDRIGEHAYKRLKQRFLKMEEKMEGYSDISRSFLDVFQPASKLDQFTMEQVEYKEAGKSKGVPFQFDFDFSLLYAGLSEQMIPTKSLSAGVKETIKKLAFLYSFTPVDMQKVVLLALDDSFTITEDRLKKAAADYYKLTISKNAPKLKKSFEQPKPEKTMQKEQLSKEEELIDYLETTPPAQVLKDMQGGKEPLPADVLFAQQLVMNHQMPIGVVNVLLQYVLLRTDMKLTKNYAEKIASHWIRKNIKNAKEAMALARNEHAQYLQWKNEGSKKAVPAKKALREEKVPEWFYKKQQTPATQEPQQSPVNVEEERRKLLAELGVSKDEVKK